MDFAVIIPARLQSSRYPGKPLIDLAGKSMIHRVWERSAEAVGSDLAFVATDDESIADHCKSFTQNIVMTSQACATGTDRVAETAEILGLGFAINVQGDEPLIEPDHIISVKEAYEKDRDVIVNAMCPIATDDEFGSLSVPKVVAATSGKLLYMSRSGIPGNKIGRFRWGFKQVCIYAFPRVALQAFASHPRTPLEEEEDIEILRFIEMGYQVQMVALDKGPIAIDTPEDRERVLKIING